MTLKNMEKEIIAPLEKNKISNATSGFCGGAPLNNTDACCVLDETIKSDGGEGCGCNTPASKASTSSCC